jgi:hypothetical protein
MLSITAIMRRLGGHDALDVVLTVELLTQPLDLCRERAHLECLLDRDLEFLEVERFGQVLGRTGLHRFDGKLDVAVSGEHDDRERAPAGPQAA